LLSETQSNPLIQPTSQNEAKSKLPFFKIQQKLLERKRANLKAEAGENKPAKDYVKDLHQQSMLYVSLEDILGKDSLSNLMRNIEMSGVFYKTTNIEVGDKLICGLTTRYSLSRYLGLIT